MIALRDRLAVRTRCALALTATAILLFASCGNAAQYLDSLRELRVVQQQLNSVVGTRDVSVNLRNGRVLTITVGNVDGNGKPGVERQEQFRRIAAAAYLAFPSRSQVEADGVVYVGPREGRDV